MSNVDNLFKSIAKGREGGNIGIKTGLSKIDSYIGGIQKKTYYLIFGLSGAGKTSYALYSYIYRPLKDYPNGNFLIVYFSLEMSTNKLLAKLLTLYLYEQFGIVISYKKLMSWEEPLPDDLYNKVLEARNWLESIEKRLIIYDKAVNRDVFYKTMMNVLEDNGIFAESEDGRRKIYIPNDPNKLILGVMDHVGLIMPKTGATRKEEIDAVSAYAVTLRERCGCSWVFLQQENRNSANMDRRKADMTECSAEDLKDTGNTYNDCEVCIGVYYPLKHKLKTCHKFPIINEDETDFKGLRDRYRGLCLIKNRDGDTEKYVSTNFFGELGLFEEFPNIEDISDFTPYLSLDRTQKDVEEQKVPRSTITYKF